MRITFKNVGHGDSIIIEWHDESGTRKVGIIDCNITSDGENPVMKHLEDAGVKIIEFIILSHPHTDHFSGLLGLLNFCERESIKIKEFLHTATYDKVVIDSNIKNSIEFDDYVKSFVRSRRRTTLFKIYNKLFNLAESGIIQELTPVNNRYVIPLDENIKLRFLAPTFFHEIRSYLTQTFRREGGGDLSFKENNPNANLLSTVIQIISVNWEVVLTSDATKTSFKKLISQEGIELGKNLVLCQVPHHGSSENHYEIFWDKVTRPKKFHAAFSVGEKYGHPDEDVVNYFDQRSTAWNTTYLESIDTGFKGSSGNERQSKINGILDSLNSFVGNPSPLKQGDLCYEIDLKGNVTRINEIE